MNKYAYRNKLAVVTVVSFGIGKAYAKELAAQACHAILAARSKDKLDAMEREINRQYGVQVYALACEWEKVGRIAPS
ncbi:short-subunit dehydrogenase [Paenibacillus sp. PvP094]|uniref:SDR family NAD(P)-dependent oxidoreductase n=1 Tax=Paenibacillus sp. PvP094 TaxID=3156394 RepID=UPI0012B84807|nr:SDR family NAD(P)-dependent oxidoreductase [Paenibacillus xylanexedens]